MSAHRCPHPVNALLPFHVNGSLSETEEEQVREHVRGCAVCDAEVEMLSGIAEVVRAAPLAVLDEARPGRPLLKKVLLVLAAALAVAVPALGIWWLAAGGRGDGAAVRHVAVPGSATADPVQIADATVGREAPPGRMSAAVYLDLKGGPTRSGTASPRLPAGSAEVTVVIALLLPERPGPADRLELTDPSGRVTALSDGPVSIGAFGRVTLVLSRSLLAAPGSYSIVLRRGADAAPAAAGTTETSLRFPFVVGD